MAGLRVMSLAEEMTKPLYRGENKNSGVAGGVVGVASARVLLEIQTHRCPQTRLKPTKEVSVICHQ